MANALPRAGSLWVRARAEGRNSTVNCRRRAPRARQECQTGRLLSVFCFFSLPRESTVCPFALTDDFGQEKFTLYFGCADYCFSANSFLPCGILKRRTYLSEVSGELRRTIQERHLLSSVLIVKCTNVMLSGLSQTGTVSWIGRRPVECCFESVIAAAERRKKYRAIGRRGRTVNQRC